MTTKNASTCCQMSRGRQSYSWWKTTNIKFGTLGVILFMFDERIIYYTLTLKSSILVAYFYGIKMFLT